MDAFAVSVSNGLCYQGYGYKQAFFSALTFGIFQALMPVIGYVAGRFFSDAISALDHWVALILLGLIGGNMVFEAIREWKSSEKCPAQKEFSIKVLLLQGVATSIDALTVGISLAVMKTDLVSAVLLIGVITFAVCLIGAQLGRKFGILLKQKARLLGGIILILIGLKIFLEHTLG